jgi:hypothetical protein
MLVAGIYSLPAAVRAGDDQTQPALPDSSFRYRWMSVNELFLRARKSRAEQSISYATYIAIVNLLREEEMSIHSQAAKHNFRDETESNYWHRGQLKFPSSLTTEQRLLSEGKDPAVNTP